jgi:G:T-mismatch repair DNA endonuclease (very short patch repair protein)
MAAKNNYAATAGIRVRESAEAKTSFWLVALESTGKADTNEIRSAAEGIWEATGWECPVDKSSVYGLCQLHELYVDGKRRRADDEAEPSKEPES